MPIFKNIFLVIFLTFFAGGKCNIKDNAFKTFSKLTIEKKDNLKEIKIFSGNDDDDENSSLKRKRKSKGVEVAVPTVSNLTLKKEVVYSEYHPSFSTRIYTSFLYCARCKRGPPKA